MSNNSIAAMPVWRLPTNEEEAQAAFKTNHLPVFKKKKTYTTL